ncbi:hypothetical protein ABF088_001536 [Salmonella enterica]
MNSVNMDDFSVWIECDTSHANKCFYTKSNDVWIKIFIQNNNINDISIPFEYLKKTGPSIKLTSVNKDDGFYLRQNLTDRELLNHLTVIHPREKVMFEWVIFSREIENLRENNKNIKLNIELSVITKVYMKNLNIGDDFIKKINFSIIEKQ